MLNYLIVLVVLLTAATLFYPKLAKALTAPHANLFDAKLGFLTTGMLEVLGGKIGTVKG